ncbi:MAG: Tll0287-like domain-containing protein [Planctomycetota bacterium]
MCSKLIKSSFSLIVLVMSICMISNKYNYAEDIENNRLECLQKLADSTINMLVATRSVIAKNQDLINIDPITGNYYFKGFVPALVGSEIANDFSLMTGHKLKQTSLKLRNPNNKPDEWEKKILNKFELSKYPKGAGFGEILETDDKEIYRYMKPIYIEKACLKCHATKDKTRPEIREFLENKYPYDQAFGYKEGDVRGGISIIISLED